ncbi:cytochrome b5 [Hypoxylon trugodes]|uniref:cytochrome b5 n=1 Tax=Hypoxylon trugodes TaxID=326681 RepID=UPI002194A3F1|nr:cytochrome b5 [Hypoxylon trugodes]KAI1389789.1 cytochrome b5 [Hypoxylon trugodes]
MSKTFTAKDVAEHKDESAGMYIIVDSGVYDITSENIPSQSAPSLLYDLILTAIPRQFLDFLDEHPGGAKILKRMAGKNATKQFWKYHGKSVLEKYGEKLKVGELTETAKL